MQTLTGSRPTTRSIFNRLSEGEVIAWNAARQNRFDQHVELTHEPPPQGRRGLHTLENALQNGTPAVMEWISTYAMLHKRGAITNPYEAAGIAGTRLREFLAQNPVSDPAAHNTMQRFSDALLKNHRAIAAFAPAVQDNKI